MKKKLLLIPLTIIIATFACNTHAWWAGTWEDERSQEAWPQKNSAPAMATDPSAPQHMTQEQYQAHKEYLREIARIKENFQAQVEADQKAFEEQMNHWYVK
jgi:hypothetical protein